MILLDPDLDARSASSTRAAGSPPQARRALAPSAERIPSVPTLKRFQAQAQAAVRLKGQVTVMLTTDKAIRRLNRQFRGKNKATDVLSFPAAPMPGVKPAERLVGDLAISIETARRQAAAQGHPLRVEIKVLMLHGLLHLAGYDHEVDSGQMARRERTLRAQLKLPQGLIERVEKPAAKTPLRGKVASEARKKGARSARS